MNQGVKHKEMASSASCCDTSNDMGLDVTEFYKLSVTLIKNSTSESVCFWFVSLALCREEELHSEDNYCLLCSSGTLLVDANIN